jgi:predicted small metal-binding protein
MLREEDVLPSAPSSSKGAVTARAEDWREPMPKLLECAKVDPSSGCQHVVWGETEEEVLWKAAEHAQEHGVWEVMPEVMERVKSNIRDA